jgi:hypothetical protein
MFPDLVQLREPEEVQAILDEPLASFATEDAEDPVSGWVSAEEYAILGSTERNQLALDRYLASHKSRWQIGRDYEQYVGFLRERDGYRVTYHGILAGRADLGRDLVCERDGRIEIVQCKCWSRERLIHEKHVFQLFGTVVLQRIDSPMVDVIGSLVTTTTLSETAISVAEQLGITVEQDFSLGPFPRVKCNVARDTAERIYHLPFDQQYDKTTIEVGRGECYAMSCAEAEAKGFRRAWRWHSAASES